MKKTTYIVLGMFGAGLLIILGFMLYLHFGLVKIEQTPYVVEGKMEKVALVNARHIVLEMDYSSRRGDNDRVLYCYGVDDNRLAVTASQEDAFLQLPAAFMPYTKTKQRGDTVMIKISVSNYMRAHVPEPKSFPKPIAFPKLQLELGKTVEGIELRYTQLDLLVTDVEKDRLNLVFDDRATLRDSRIDSLAVSDFKALHLNNSQLGYMQVKMERDDPEFTTDSLSLIKQLDICASKISLDKIRFEEAAIHPRTPDEEVRLHSTQTIRLHR